MSPRAARTALAIPELPVERFTLSCGATLLVSRRPGAPICAVAAHVRGGHSLDPPGKEGTAYLTGRLVDQGTRSRTEEELALALEGVGGGLQGGPTGLAGTAPNRHWRLLFEIFCECLREPAFPRDRVERHRRRLIDRLRVDLADPRIRGAQLFRELVYGSHWLGRPDTGTPESLEGIRRADLVRFHARHWRGRRLLVAVCGDLDPPAVRRALERGLRGLPRGTELPPPDRSFPPRSIRTAVFRADRQQVHVFLGHLGIQRNHPDYPALVVMDHILGTGPGFTSRITRRLRDELGLAYTVQADISGSAGVLPGTFTAYIGTSPEHLATAVKGFLQEIRRIQERLVSPAELDLAKSYLTGSFPLGFERASRRVQTLVLAERCGLPESHLADLLMAFQSVSRADVQRVARAHLDPDRPCLVVAGPVRRSAVRALLAPTPARADT